MGHVDWATIPWNGREKPPAQCLYDHFFSLGEILEQIHKPTLRTGQAHPQVYLKLLAQCKDLNSRLERWHLDLVDSKPGIYSENCQYGVVDQMSIDEACYTDYEFADIAVAHMIMNYWGLQIRLYETIAEIFEMAEDCLIKGKS